MKQTAPLDEIAVSWTVDDIPVEATLTRPRGDGPFPAVIMVAGSGPTDRDWNTPLLPGTNGSAALLARALTDAGFVTLRYDKRGSGPHVQENVARLAGRISSQGHLDELAGGMHLLAERADVDPARIFILGNSEGCYHALNYQAHAPNAPAAGLVLTAPPARPVGLLARAQITAQVAGAPDADAWLASYDAAMADFVAGRPVQVDPSLPEGLRNLILAVTTPVNQPFARELWVTDPLVWLAGIAAPVLVLIGKKDLQVDWQTDGALLEEAAADRANITIVYPEEANHVLKHEPRGRSQISAADAAVTYNAPEAVLDAVALEAILTWLKTKSA